MPNPHKWKNGTFYNFHVHQSMYTLTSNIFTNYYCERCGFFFHGINIINTLFFHRLNVGIDVRRVISNPSSFPSHPLFPQVPILIVDSPHRLVLVVIFVHLRLGWARLLS